MMKGCFSMSSINFGNTTKNKINDVQYLFNRFNCPNCREEHSICITDAHGPSLLTIKKDASRTPKDTTVTTSIGYSYRQKDSSGKERAYLPVRLPCSSEIVPILLEGIPAIGVKTLPIYEKRKTFESFIHLQL